MRRHHVEPLALEGSCPSLRNEATSAGWTPGGALSMAWTRRSLRGRIRDLEAQVAELRAKGESPRRSAADEPPSTEDHGHDRRAFLRLGATGAVGALGAVLADGRPAAALDPNDVARSAANPVTSPTTLTGAFNNTMLAAYNGSTGTAAAAILGSSAGPASAPSGARTTPRTATRSPVGRETDRTSRRPGAACTAWSATPVRRRRSIAPETSSRSTACSRPPSSPASPASPASWHLRTRRARCTCCTSRVASTTRVRASHRRTS